MRLSFLVDISNEYKTNFDCFKVGYLKNLGCWVELLTGYFRTYRVY
jgi:hypothetical protein